MSRGTRIRRAGIGASVAATLMLAGASIVAAADQPVNIIDYAFDPPDITVNVGDTVTWTNTGEDTHTVKFDDGESRPLSNGDTYERTFDAAGTFAYICGIHSSMTGSVTVEGAAATATAAPSASAGASAEPSADASAGASATPSQPPTDVEAVSPSSPSAPVPVWWFAIAGVAAIFAAGLMVRRLQGNR